MVRNEIAMNDRKSESIDVISRLLFIQTSITSTNNLAKEAAGTSIESGGRKDKAELAIY
jgi:hypothetical protein